MVFESNLGVFVLGNQKQTCFSCEVQVPLLTQTQVGPKIGDTVGLFILAFCFLKGTIHKIVGDHSEPFTTLWGTIENYSQVVGRYSELFTHCGWGRYSELFTQCGSLFRTIHNTVGRYLELFAELWVF